MTRTHKAIHGCSKRPHPCQILAVLVILEFSCTQVLFVLVPFRYLWIQILSLIMAFGATVPFLKVAYEVTVSDSTELSTLRTRFYKNRG